MLNFVSLWLIDDLPEFAVKKWLYVHVLGQILLILWTTQLYHITLLMFIPIAGRSGAGTNPDFMIGYISVALTILTISYMVSGRPELSSHN